MLYRYTPEDPKELTWKALEGWRQFLLISLVGPGAVLFFGIIVAWVFRGFWKN